MSQSIADTSASVYMSADKYQASAVQKSHTRFQVSENLVSVHQSTLTCWFLIYKSWSQFLFKTQYWPQKSSIGQIVLCLCVYVLDLLNEKHPLLLWAGDFLTHSFRISTTCGFYGNANLCPTITISPPFNPSVGVRGWCRVRGAVWISWVMWLQRWRFFRAVRLIFN